MSRKVLLMSVAYLTLTACSGSENTTTEPAVDVSALEASLLDVYEAAINSKDLEAIMGLLTEDVVLQAPHGPEVAGVDAVREWVGGYLAAFDSDWEKTTLDFEVRGDLAIQRYAYKSTDTHRESGEVYTDEGKGLLIHRRGDDGQWRVWRDSWSTDLPIPVADVDTRDAENAAIIKSMYDGFAAGDIAKVTKDMSSEIVWNEADSIPYAEGNPYIGPEAVTAGIFGRIATEWTGFSAVPDNIVSSGGRVVALGYYGGTFNASGKAMDVPFVHAWTVENSQVTTFQQYTDTKIWLDVMMAEDVEPEADK